MRVGQGMAFRFGFSMSGSFAAGFIALGLILGAALPGAAQQQRVPIDSIFISGTERTESSAVRLQLGFAAGDTIDIQDIRAAQKRLWAGRDYSDIRIFARGTGAEGDPVIVEVRLVEAPIVHSVIVTGLERASRDVVADSAGLESAQPYTEADVVLAERMIRNALARAGIPFARIESRTEEVPDQPGQIDVIIEVDEGDRVAIAEWVIEGNEAISDEDIVGVVRSKPEGFFWFRSGTFEERAFSADLGLIIPDLYRSRGYLDFEILSDTVIVDPNSGKARVELQVSEGPRYRIAQLNIEGNRVFDDERLEPFFLPGTGGLLGALGIGGDDELEARGRVFDAVAFQAAADAVGSVYANEGYIFAGVQPTITRNPPASPGEDPTVSLDVTIVEGQPAFIDDVMIRGNDYTYDRVIRQQIAILPGDTYSQDRILQSMQAIEGLGFFEPITTPPDIQVDRETGEVDVTFIVEEKRTGTINFGTSVGGSAGISGFIGYEQPNLFGQAKSGNVRWDFGRFVNNFTLSFTDPALFQTRTSGTISLFNSRDRFFQFSSGRRRRIGGSVRFGFPLWGALRTRVFTGYSISRTEYDLFNNSDDTSLFGRPPGTLSQVSVGVTRSTLNNPLFPTSGSRQNWTMAVNGGVLGGDGDFTKHTIEAEIWAPVWQFGGETGAPSRVALGTKLKGGAIVGDVGDFPFERFWMGGVQFGENLRGYDETSITPFGYFPEGSSAIADIDRTGDAFMTVSTELALRLGGQFTLRGFFDAGNTWQSFDEINPGRLFRGAGFGTTVVTPFGPIGIDYAYGFDKLEPGWQLHFTFGQGF